MFARRRQQSVAAYRRFMGEELEEPYSWVKEIGQAIKGDEEFAVRALKEAEARPIKKIGLTPRRVAAVVAKSQKLNLEDLRSSSRRRNLSRARILAAYLGRREAGIPVAQTARLFDREESTMNRGVLRLESEIAASKTLAGEVAKMAARLLNE